MNPLDSVALIRIEHKLDALIQYLTTKDASCYVLPLTTPFSVCSACKTFARYVINPSLGTVARACSCQAPVAVDVSDSTPKTVTPAPVYQGENS